MSWLEQLWRERRDKMRLVRAEKMASDAQEVPATYGTCTGGPTPHPWSATAGALNRLPRVMNLDKLRRRVLELVRKS